MEYLDNTYRINLSPEQESAIKMLTSGCSVRYTALVLGVKETIISSWIARDPAFKSRLKETESFDPADELEEAETLNEAVGE